MKSKMKLLFGILGIIYNLDIVIAASNTENFSQNHTKRSAEDDGYANFPMDNNDNLQSGNQIMEYDNTLVGTACGTSDDYEQVYFEAGDGSGLGCGIKNGHKCPKADNSGFQCAGFAKCRQWKRPGAKNGELEFACSCNLGTPARIHSFCGIDKRYTSGLFYTLLFHPIESGFMGAEFLERLDGMVQVFDRLEDMMEYSEPSAQKRCPVEISKKVEESLNYFGTGYLDPSQFNLKLQAINEAVMGLTKSSETLCDYRYPLKCSDEGICVLRSNDIFLRSIKSTKTNKVSELEGVTVWDLLYAENENCNHPVGINSAFLRIHQLTVRYPKGQQCGQEKDDLKCLPLKSGKTYKDFPGTKISSCRKMQDDGETRNPDGGGNTPTPENLCTADSSSSEILEHIKTLNGRRQTRSTLGYGDKCDYQTIHPVQGDLRYYNNLINSGPKVPFTNEELLSICNSLKKIDSSSTSKLCDSRKLLYCNNASICDCFGGGFTRYQDDCILGDKKECGESWVNRLDDVAEIQGLPSTSPMCDSMNCSTIAGDMTFRCRESSFGLLMVIKS